MSGENKRTYFADVACSAATSLRVPMNPFSMNVRSTETRNSPSGGSSSRAIVNTGYNYGHQFLEPKTNSTLLDKELLGGRHGFGSSESDVSMTRPPVGPSNEIPKISAAINIGGATSGNNKAENSFDNGILNSTATKASDSRLRRILSNRASAQRARKRKCEYVAAMEKEVRDLEAKIAMLSPEVSHHKIKQHYLETENKRLNQQISDRAAKDLIVCLEIKVNMTEIIRLRQLQFDRQQQNLQNYTSSVKLETNIIPQPAIFDQQVMTPAFNYFNQLPLPHLQQFDQLIPNSHQGLENHIGTSNINENRPNQLLDLINKERVEQGQEWNNVTNLLPTSGYWQKRAELEQMIMTLLPQNHVLANPNFQDLGDGRNDEKKEEI